MEFTLQHHAQDVLGYYCQKGHSRNMLETYQNGPNKFIAAQGVCQPPHRDGES